MRRASGEPPSDPGSVGSDPDADRAAIHRMLPWLRDPGTEMPLGEGTTSPEEAIFRSLPWLRPDGCNGESKSCAGCSSGSGSKSGCNGCTGCSGGAKSSPAGTTKSGGCGGCTGCSGGAKSSPATVADSALGSRRLPENPGSQEDVGKCGWLPIEYHYTSISDDAPTPVLPLACISAATATVEAISIVGLREICVIDLGPCPLVANHPSAFPSTNNLRYELPVDFEPTSSHHEMMEALLPTWRAQIHSFDGIWDIADRVLQRHSGVWSGGDEQWDTRGLFWREPGDDGFFLQAFRYAIATLYAYAYSVDAEPLFTDVTTLGKDQIRQLLDDPVLHYIVTPIHTCDYSADKVRVVDGVVQADRTWQKWAPDDVSLVSELVALSGLIPSPVPAPIVESLLESLLATGVLSNNPTAITLQTGLGGSGGGQTRVSDGFIVNAALADYHFWWAHRLYDWVESGNAGAGADGVRFLAVCCARAALAEIVDIAGNLVHEIAHLGRFLASEWECRYDPYSTPLNVVVGALDLLTGLPIDWLTPDATVPLKCATMHTSWIFRSVLKADLALPVSLLEDVATFTQVAYEFDQNSTTNTRTTGGLGSAIDRFNFDRGVGWAWRYESWQGDCYGANLEVHHYDLWTEGHHARINWTFPTACDVDGGTGHGATVVN